MYGESFSLHVARYEQRILGNEPQYKHLCCASVTDNTGRILPYFIHLFYIIRINICELTVMFWSPAHSVKTKVC